ncbi:MAG TPA: glycosyltransferase family 2 protein [Candidatus Moranbacteria bacterium]|nr:glycosyltransferase family 2 protein [Candidatus Moranbacteria bacterium]
MEISAAQKYKVSIVIVNFQSKKYLASNLLSIRNKISSELISEIIIVNNDRKENLEEIEAEFPKIKLIECEKNIGFGAANNLAAKKALGRYLFFLNPDCEIINCDIKKIIFEMEKDAKIGIIGGQLLKKNGETQQWSAGIETSLLNLIKNNLGFSRSRKIWKSEKKITTDWVSGTAMIIEKNLFQKIGGFDEKFFMYFEDMDLCGRIRKIGRKIVYFPQLKARHLEGGSYERREVKKKDYYDSQEYFFKKNRPKIEFWIIKSIRNFLYV